MSDDSAKPFGTDEAAATSAPQGDPLASAIDDDFDLTEADDDDRAAKVDELDYARAAARGNFDPYLAYRKVGTGGETSPRKYRFNARSINDSLVAQGDININNYGREEQTAELAPPIPQYVLDGISRVFVRPSGFPDLDARLRGGDLLVARIHPRWGATTTAIRLLAQFRSIYEVKLEAELTALPIEELPEGAGFIVDPLTPDQVAGLSSLDLKRMEQQLAERHSKAVVIIDDSTRLFDHGIERLALRLESPPPADELVENHLNELIEAPEETRRLLETEGLGEWLRTMESDGFDAHLLVALAHDLADVAAGRGTVKDARANFEDRSTRDVEAWIDAIADDSQTMTTVCALSVFNGAPYDTIRRAATKLQRAWNGEYGEEPQPGRKHRPARRSERLVQARAHVSVREPRQRRGRSAIPVAEFIDAGYPTRVLDYVWREYDDYADLLLPWLESMTAGSGIDAGVRAAAAIGYLGQFDFPRVRREVIARWARSGRGDRREHAVVALSMLVGSAANSSQVIDLVKDWCGSDSRPLRMAATRALGSAVGPAMPGGPDERLGGLAKKADRGLAVAIGLSVRELIAEAGPERRAELVRLIDEWAQDQSAGRRRAGVASFLQCARLQITIQDGSGTSRWPLLLWLADSGDSPALREGIARLLGAALLAPGFAGAIRAVLRNWASAAERSEPLRNALARLCQDAAPSPMESDELRFHATNWRTNDHIAPDFAAVLLAILDRKA
ncbi:hypothetical protein [Glycomyces buryatensis]|uniref:Uncharacterized protein n=1 Tax=Glycomyces buryatensis TaxID=2570927 RepID=A0A4S8QC76_9ACTN|nr:hypothetical protein [Glycomyces buryatensis]THV42123.1 hypothetical protein FAB82_07730 [Glycomyces buryatensis]